MPKWIASSTPLAGFPAEIGKSRCWPGPGIVPRCAARRNRRASTCAPLRRPIPSPGSSAPSPPRSRWIGSTKRGRNSRRWRAPCPPGTLAIKVYRGAVREIARRFGASRWWRIAQDGLERLRHVAAPLGLAVEEIGDLSLRDRPVEVLDLDLPDERLAEPDPEPVRLPRRPFGRALGDVRLAGLVVDERRDRLRERVGEAIAVRRVQARERRAIASLQGAQADAPGMDHFGRRRRHGGRVYPRLRCDAVLALKPANRVIPASRACRSASPVETPRKLRRWSINRVVSPCTRDHAAS